MSCNQIQTKVGPYVDGELRSHERDEVENHLNECSDCREMATAFRSLDQLAGSRSAPRVAADEWSTVLDSVKKRQQGSRILPRRGSRWEWLAPAAALAAILVLALFIAPSSLFNSSEESAEPPIAASDPDASRASPESPENSNRIANLEDYVEIIDEGTDSGDIDIQIINEGEDVDGASHLRFPDF